MSMFLQILAVGDIAGNNSKTLAEYIGKNTLKLRKEEISKAMTDFQRVEHRLEYVTTVRGIEFINDSKSTTVNATWFSLQAIHKKIVLIIGGVDKGNDYSELVDIVKKKVTSIVCIGSDPKSIRKIYQAFDDEAIVTAGNMDEAVELAYSLAEKDQAVLLSPACSSFDQFQNFEHRGWWFKAAVKAL
ncbi:MAG: hypothetical protein COA65_09775 [Rhodospirillaceae bacterium]|nr:MAG: hypothetical protein COA65_09775 [Rhodospirillaceae bacterium]